VKKGALVYGLKIWLSAIVFGSLTFSTTFELTRDDTIPEPIKYIVFWALVASICVLIFSIPGFVLFYFSILFLSKKTSISKINRKLAIGIAGLVVCIITFALLLLVGHVNVSDSYFSLPYVAFVITGIWFYKSPAVLLTSRLSSEQQ